MNRRLLYLLVTACFAGASLASLLLAFTLRDLVYRFAGDLDEIVWTWKYVQSFTVGAFLSATAAVLAYRRAMREPIEAEIDAEYEQIAREAQR